MSKKLNPNEGTIETPPDYAALLQQLEDELLAPRVKKTVAQPALPETPAPTKKVKTEEVAKAPVVAEPKVVVTQAEVDAYIAELDASRKAVSPFEYDQVAVENAEREVAANNRAAKRVVKAEKAAGVAPLVFQPEVVELEEGAEESHSPFDIQAQPDKKNDRTAAPETVVKKEKKQKQEAKPVVAKSRETPVAPAAVVVETAVLEEPIAPAVEEIPLRLEFVRETEAAPKEEVTADPTELDAKIAQLREEVASERAAFIAVEESQKSAWKNLTRIFRGVQHRDSDESEVAKYRAWYDEKILALQDAELEKLKASGLSIKEQRPMMAALIREFEFDEAERIYDTRQEMRLSKTNQPLLEKMRALWGEAGEGIDNPTTHSGEVKAWLKLFTDGASTIGGAALQGLEKGGVAYNKLMRSKAGKWILGATVLGSGAIVLGVGTGGVGAVAVGALALKRLAAGAGVAVAADQVMDKYANYRRGKKRDGIETDHEKMFNAMEAEELIDVKRLEEKESVDYSAFEKFLKEEARPRRGEQARRRNELLRKSGAIFAGAVLGSGAASHFLGQYIGGGSQAHAAPVIPGVIESSLPAEGAAATGGPMGSDVARPGISPGVSAELPSAAQSTLLSVHEVKSGENIWKLATKAVQGIPGMDDRSSERFAKLVELKLQAKLEASPELARAAGFTPDADGKFSPQHIQAGAKIELGKLISAEEMTALVDDAKSGVMPEAVSADPETQTRTTVTEITPSTGPVVTPEAHEAAVFLEEKEAAKAIFELTPEQELFNSKGDIMKYIESLPKDDQEKLFRNFKKLSTELLQTSDVMGSETYDMRYDPAQHPEFTKLKVNEVLSDHGALTKNPLFSYDRAKNPLHWSQMEEMAKLVKASAKAFGAEYAKARSGESIQEYVLRMAALSGHGGKKIPGFRMLD